MTDDPRESAHEGDAEYAEAAAIWNAMSQEDRTRLVLLAVRLHQLVDAQELDDASQP